MRVQFSHLEYGFHIFEEILQQNLRFIAGGELGEPTKKTRNSVYPLGPAYQISIHGDS